jgi:hypothetical protein
MFVPTALLAAAAVPLVLKLVPPNRLYGVRTCRTLADRDLWFRVNRFAGWAFLGAAALATCFYVADPDLASGSSLSGVLALLGPVLAAIAATGAYSRGVGRHS